MRDQLDAMKLSHIFERLQGQGDPVRGNQCDGAAGDCRAPSNSGRSVHACFGLTNTQ